MRNPSANFEIVAAKSFGVSFAVYCRPADILAVQARFPSGWQPANQSEVEHRFTLAPVSKDDDLFSVKRGASMKTRPQPFNSAIRILQKEIHLCIAENARHFAFIHAGVVAWNNYAVIFPGFSGVGKSTLVWSLVQAGATYYSDEYAVFDEDGLANPFPLPIRLRLANGENRVIIPDRVGSTRLETRVMVLARYHPGAMWRARPLGAGESVLRLIQHSISIRANPKFVLSVLKRVSLQVASFTGTRGHPEQILEWLSTERTDSRVA
jgi:hypothetical protein